jgi:hypothetical protein
MRDPEPRFLADRPKLEALANELQAKAEYGAVSAAHPTSRVGKGALAHICSSKWPLSS